MTSDEIADLLSAISDAYGGRAPKPAVGVLTMWTRMLADVDARDARRALEAHVAASPHPPTIADIRTRMAASRLGAPDLAAAWEEVRKGIQRWGRNKAPTWSHPLIERVVESMGWIELCGMLKDDLPTWRAQFRGFYQAVEETASRRENIGALEAHETRTGAVSAGAALKQLLGNVKERPMREPGEDDDDRDPTDLGLSAPAPAHTAPEQLPPAVPGVAMSDSEIAERLRALGMTSVDTGDVARFDEAARARRAAYAERMRREGSK